MDSIKKSQEIIRFKQNKMKHTKRVSFCLPHCDEIDDIIVVPGNPQYNNLPLTPMSPPTFD